jgi:hypothetical protein
MKMLQRFTLSGSAWLVVLAGCFSPAAARNADSAGAIVIARQGSFEAGGRLIGSGERTLSCDHGHVEYQIPVQPRALPLFLWHSSSAAVWQRRWDGGEGFQSILLRRGFATYVWDGPRVGRANYGCVDYTHTAQPGQDQGNWMAWRLGPRAGEWFSGIQFPTSDPEAWNQATRARYDEFDTIANAQLEADAAARAIERIGPSVLLTNSAGGMRALLTALRTDNVAAIVAYENPGYVFPEGEGPPDAAGGFGPIHVPAAEFAKLTRIPIQLVWGDNIDKSPVWSRFYAQAEAFVRIVNAHGGRAEMLRLSDAGLHGNTHIPFADLNNIAVADQLSAFLHRKRLDGRPAH